MKKQNSKAGQKTLHEQFAFMEFFRPVLGKLGIDYNSMMEVLVLKATILLRTEIAAGQNLKKKKADTTETEPAFFSFKRNLQLLLLSFLVSIMAWFFQEPIVMLAMVFIPGFLMQVLRVITTFPVLVIETKDITLIATQPISPASIATAKNFLIFLYLLTESICLYSFACIPFILKAHYSILPGLALAIIMANLICVVLVYLLYGLVLRFYDGEKLKDLITLLQIILNIAAILFTNIISRATQLIEPTASINFRWWHPMIPPLSLCWIGNMFTSTDALLSGAVSLGTLLALILFHFLFTARMVDNNLGKLLREGENKRGTYEFRKKLREACVNFIFQDPPSRAFYLFSSAVVDNDRKIKQLVYPIFASALLLPAIILFSSWQASKASLGELFDKAPFLVLVFYLSALILLGSLDAMKRCDKPVGSWFFKLIPDFTLFQAQKAAGLVFIVRFLLLPLSALSLLLLLTAGLSLLPHLCAIMCGTVLLGMFKIRRTGPYWPHSLDLLAIEPHSTRRFLIELSWLLVTAGLHALAYALFMQTGLFVLCILFIIGIMFQWFRPACLKPQKAKP